MCGSHSTYNIDCVYHVPGIVLGSVGTGDIMLKEKKKMIPSLRHIQYSGHSDMIGIYMII